MALLRWYEKARRDLPWRRTRDPYAIWLSEVMLQQTRVETVIPYYERFLARWPTVAALAEAPVDDVLGAWSGLGYYRRARMLHAAAGEIAGQRAFPSDAQSLARVKGIGRYTAGAVASIAYGEAAPLVDGNVARVFARLFAIEDDVREAKGTAKLWRLAEELVHLRSDRLERNRRLAGRLADLGLPATYEEAVAEAGGEEGMGRPHFASVLVRAGAADSIQDAFDRYLGAGRPAYVTKGRLSPADVARLATASGGVAVLAHPFSSGLDGDDLAGLVGVLAEAGFAGLEATYGRYSPRQRQQLGNLARRFDLVATGGSDHHGTIKPDLTVGTGQGDLKVPDAVLVELEGRRPGA